MGDRKSSSKKKSSKRKSLKVSSKDRKRKNRRNKSKKLSSSEDYTSSSDYSSCPQSSSSSSSEDDYSKKSRRHSRDVKHVKKGNRRRSSSRDLSEGSPPVKKRKRSNRKSLDRGRKVQKKKRRRFASISSKGSDPKSCSSCRYEINVSSTCQYETTLEDGDVPNPRMNSRKKMKEMRILDEPIIEERSTSRGARCSSCDDLICSCSTTLSRKGYAEENIPKRLRSVIIVPEKTHEEEGDEPGTDLLEEEILSKHHHCLSNQMTQVENLMIGDACSPNNENLGPKKNGCGIDSHTDKLKEVSPDKGDESGISDNIAADSSFEDLETLLRKKALENLQKFRKELRTNYKSGAKEKKNESAVNQLSPKTEVPHEPLEQVNREGLALHQELGCRSKLVISEEVSHSTKNEINATAEEDSGRESVPAFVDEAESGKMSCSTRDSVQTETEEKILASNPNIINNTGMGAGNAYIPPTVEITSSVSSTSDISNNQPDEAKDGSQFENKTLSVMRGGEMVQVSYKVYIPKRAPALSRRQLKR